MLNIPFDKILDYYENAKNQENSLIKLQEKYPSIDKNKLLDIIYFNNDDFNNKKIILNEDINVITYNYLKSINMLNDKALIKLQEKYPSIDKNR